MLSRLKAFVVAVAAGVLVLTALPAAAQERPSAPDQELVAQLHQLGQDEIATAGLAETRAVSPRVMVLAVELRRAHRIQNAKLMDYAERKNMNTAVIERPGDALAHGVLARAPLANSRPEEFDYNFVSQVVADHQAAIDAAAAAQRLARDPELKGTIGGLLVMLTEHLVAAQEVLAATPAPTPRIVQLPAFPAGVSRTQTGADVPPPGAREMLQQMESAPNR
jgi:predicted outer membrane protein